MKQEKKIGQAIWDPENCKPRLGLNAVRCVQTEQHIENFKKRTRPLSLRYQSGNLTSK